MVVAGAKEFVNTVVGAINNKSSSSSSSSSSPIWNSDSFESSITIISSIFRLKVPRTDFSLGVELETLVAGVSNETVEEKTFEEADDLAEAETEDSPHRLPNFRFLGAGV